MEFFNKKEEVIEVVLTQKGKELFASGSFNPVYYSFCDEDITYDNNSGEEQNSIVPRIKETPTLKSVSCIQYNPQKIKKEFKLKTEIGSKTIGDQYAPAWNLKFLETPLFQYYGENRDKITDNKKYELPIITNFEYDEGTLELIPQFNIQTVYQVMDVKELEENKFAIEFVSQDFSLEGFKNYIFKTLNDLDPTFTYYEITSYGEINFGVPTQVYKIFLKDYNQEFLFLENTIFNKAEELYNNTMIPLVEKFNELFPFQLQTVEEFVLLMKEGFKTEYSYDYQSIIDLVKEISKLYDSFNQLKIPDITGEELVSFKDQFKNPVKLFLLNFKITKSLWLIKDPGLLMNVEEYNAYEINEKPQYDTEYYFIEDDTGLYYKLDTKEVRKYINIYFDNLADIKYVNNIKNIYQDITKADDSLC
jgi:hypothetical protein